MSAHRGQHPTRGNPVRPRRTAIAHTGEYAVAAALGWHERPGPEVVPPGRAGELGVHHQPSAPAGAAELAAYRLVEVAGVEPGQELRLLVRGSARRTGRGRRRRHPRPRAARSARPTRPPARPQGPRGAVLVGPSPARCVGWSTEHSPAGRADSSRSGAPSTRASTRGGSRPSDRQAGRAQAQVLASSSPASWRRRPGERVGRRVAPARGSRPAAGTSRTSRGRRRCRARASAAVGGRCTTPPPRPARR